MKIFNVNKEQILIVLYVIIISTGVFTAFKNETVETFSMPVAKKVIVIDAGHGGWYPCS